MWTGSHVNSSSQKPQEALSTSRHPTPRQAGEFRGPPKGGAKRGADADPAVGRPLPSAPNRAHATLSPGAREQSPRPRHGRPTTRLGHPWATTQLPRAPPSLFGWPGAERPPSVTPPQTSPWDLPRVPGPRTAAAGSPRSPQPAPPAPRPRSRPRGAGPRRRPRCTRLAPAPRADLLLATTACSNSEHRRPSPEAPGRAPARPPGLPCRPGTPRLRRARGRFWGRECKQIGVL